MCFARPVKFLELPSLHAQTGSGIVRLRTCSERFGRQSQTGKEDGIIGLGARCNIYACSRNDPVSSPNTGAGIFAGPFMANSTLSSDPVLYNSDFLRPGERDGSLGLILLSRPLPRVTLHLWHRGM